MTPGSSTTLRHRRGGGYPRPQEPPDGQRRADHRRASEHRAGKDAEGRTGDGVGILLQISHKFFSKVADELNISIAASVSTGWGCSSSPRRAPARPRMKLFELVTRKEAWPPRVAQGAGGPRDPWAAPPATVCPPSGQVLYQKAGQGVQGIDFDRRLYIVRRVFEQASKRHLCGQPVQPHHRLQGHVPWWGSCAASTPTCRTRTTSPPSAWCTAAFPPTPPPAGCGPTPTASSCTTARSHHQGQHRRHAGPGGVHFLAHHAGRHEQDFAHRQHGRLRFCHADNTLEFMVMNGMDLPLAVMITIPEPWRTTRTSAAKSGTFNQYYATMLEPWDGPAAILFSGRRRGGRGAGPQRPAPQPLHHHQGRPDDPVLRGGRAGLPARKRPGQDRLRPARCCWWTPSRAKWWMTKN